MKNHKEDIIFFLHMFASIALLKVVFTLTNIVYSDPDKVLLGVLVFAVFRIERTHKKVIHLLKPSEDEK